MKKGRLWTTLICALAAALVLTLTAAATQYIGGAAAQERTAAVMLLPQTDGTHAGYMNGDAQGLFQPEKALTRGELAQVLCALAADQPSALPSLYDVPGDAWYAQPARTAVGLGLMIDDAGFFRPGDPVTRAECAYALSQLLPYDVPMADVFQDVWPGYWAYQAVCRTAGQGLFYGDGQGNFRPEDSLRRCEAVAVFNRLLGRSPDLRTLNQRTDLYAFPDVPPTHWAYAEIMEATVAHQYVDGGEGMEQWTYAEAPAPAASQPVVPVEPEPAAPETAPPTEAAGLPDGPVRIDGHLYWVVDGSFARSCGMTGLQFDENGWYTTGDEELDGMLNDIVDRLVNDSMTRDEKLRVLFDYVRKNFTYLKRPLVSKGQTGWEPEYAKFFLTNGRGNCFSFAAAYCLLCREAGIPAYTVVGTSGGSPHGWVEIYMDETIYMFDPELQWYYDNRTTKKYDLFKMLPTKIPSGVYRYAW